MGIIPNIFLRVFKGTAQSKNEKYFLAPAKKEISVQDPHFFADPDPIKKLHADPDPNPGGIRG